MKKTRLLVTLLLAFVFQFSFAQEMVITGKVSDESGPLPGVTVLVKGTNNGTQTDFDGKYTLKKVKKGAVLVFSYVGMSTVEKKVGASKEINVVMESSNTLGEVMVVAYGTAKKSSFTGSASKVDGEKLEMKNTSEISKAIASEAPGVQVINSSGQPGSNAKIRIRGYGSVNASRNPLYIVDGMPFEGDASSIDPSDVESTTILKDASATALYGARGANGVILITTKKGKKGTSKIEVSLKTGINTQLLPMYDVIESPEKYMEYTWESMRNRYSSEGVADDKLNGKTINEYTSENLFGNEGIAPGYNMWKKTGVDLIDATTGKFKTGAERRYTPGSWRDAIFSNGVLKEVGVKFSGGSGKTTHYTSLSYRDDEGYYIQSNFKRLSARMNLISDIKDWLKVGVNMGYAHLRYSDPGQGSNANNGFAFVNNIPSIFPVFSRDADGNKIKDTRIGGYLYDYGFALGSERPFSGGINPAGAVRLDKAKNISHQVVVSPSLEFKLTEDFKLITKFTGQYLMSGSDFMTNFFYGDAKGIGRVSKINSQYATYTFNQILNWSHDFGDHHLSALAGHEAFFIQYKRLRGAKSKVADPYSSELDNAIIMDDISSYTSELSLESYLAQFKYDFDEKYYLTLNARRDGTSRFPNGKWGNFGAVGAAWMISKEDFLESVDWLKELKLKASYGVLGNQGVLNDNGTSNYYPTRDYYTISNLNGGISLQLGAKKNPDLTWERSATLNTGIEFNIADVVEGSVEYFVKNTTNLLYEKQVPRSLGYAVLPVNDGAILNSGIEFALDTHIVDTNDFKVDFSINGSHYKNEITEMPKAGADNKPKYYETAGIYGRQKGHSLYDYYIREFAGVNPETGVSEWYAYYDEVNGEKKLIGNMEAYIEQNGKVTKLIQEKTSNYDDATQKFVGKSLIPDLAGGMGLDVSYKGFSLGAQFIYSIGGYIYDSGYASLMHNKAPGARNWHKDIEKRWQKAGDITDVPRLSNDLDKKVNSTSTRFLTDASYFGLNTANLSYSFAKNTIKSIGLEKLSIFVSGDNLFLFTKRKGLNPTSIEEGKNTNNYNYSPLSTFSAGIKLEF